MSPSPSSRFLLTRVDTQEQRCQSQVQALERALETSRDLAESLHSEKERLQDETVAVISLFV